MEKLVEPKQLSWQRALEEPISEETPWELLDEFRRELFTRLDLYTEWPVWDDEDRSERVLWLAEQIQKVAERLKLLAVLIPAAGEEAVAAGRAKKRWLGMRCPLCQRKRVDSAGK